jgi:hypothetical protein
MMLLIPSRKRSVNQTMRAMAPAARAQLELLALPTPACLPAPVRHEQLRTWPELQGDELVRIDGDCSRLIGKQMLAALEVEPLPAVLRRRDLRIFLRLERVDQCNLSAIAQRAPAARTVINRLARGKPAVIAEAKRLNST